MATQQDQAIALANSIISMTANLHAIQLQINEVSASWTNLSAAVQLIALTH